MCYSVGAQEILKHSSSKLNFHHSNTFRVFLELNMFHEPKEVILNLIIK